MFEHCPIKGTKKDKFEHLINVVDSPNFSLVQDLIKSAPSLNILEK